LIAAPVGLLSFNLILDVAYVLGGSSSVAKASYYSLVGGFAGGLLAAVTGAMDYFSIPGNTPAKRTANLHGVLNLGLLALSGVNLASRRGKAAPSGKAQALLSAAGAATLLLSSWYGGSLIYEHGLRVQGIDPIANARDLRPPGDRAVETALKRLEDAAMPSARAAR
jgi:uncharacterized membrane protein